MDIDRAVEIICKRLAPLKTKEQVRAAVIEVLEIDAKRYEDALRVIADPANKANWRTQIYAKSIIDPELQSIT